MAGLFRSVAMATTRASAGTPSYGMIPPLGSVQSATGLLVSQATSMTVSTVYACVRRIATDMARCTPMIVEEQEDGSDKIITDHPLCALLTRPNDQQTWFEWAAQMWLGHELRQNGYAACKRDRRARPQQLIPINPDAVMVLEAGDGSIFYNVNRIGLWQIAMLAEFPAAIAEEDIFHLRGLTFNSLVGVSTIGLARDAIGLAMALEQQASRWLANGARPALGLKTPRTLSDDAAKRLKTQIDSNHAGIQNTGKTIVYEEGLEPVIMQMNGVDIQFVPQRANQVLEICRFFGVPPHKVGVVDRGSVQNIAQQDQDYVNTTIMQRVEMFEQKWTLYFGLDKEGLKLRLNEGQLLRADVLTRRNAARLGILSSITTPDEERRGERLPPKGGRAGELQFATNTAAAGSDITGTAPDKAGRPKDGTVADSGVPTGGNTDESLTDANETDTPPQN